MQRRTFIVLLVLAGVPAILAIVAHLIVTDEEAIEQVTRHCRDALLEGDAERILEYIEEGATAEGSLLGRGDLASKVRPWVNRTRGQLKRIVLDCRKTVVRGDDAEAEWTVTVHFRPGGEYSYPLARFKVLVRYVRGPTGFRIRHVAVR